MKDRDIQVAWCEASKTFDVKLIGKDWNGGSNVSILSFTTGEIVDIKKGIREATIKAKRDYKAKQQVAMQDKVKELKEANK